MKFTYPSHLCVTSNGQLCISFAGSNQLILCEIDGKVIVSLFLLIKLNNKYYFFAIGYCWKWSLRSS
jgi:hypothetical protein